MADGEHFVGERIDGDDRRLGENDPFAADVDKSVGRSKVDADIARKNARKCD